MPTKAKTVDRAVSKLPSIQKELVSLFLTGPMTGEAINEAGAAFKKALIEASLNAEPTPPKIAEHLWPCHPRLTVLLSGKSWVAGPSPAMTGKGLPFKP